MSFHKSIPDFISQLSGLGGIAHANRYWIEFNLPLGVGTNGGEYQINAKSQKGNISTENIIYNSQGQIGIMCQSAQFPGRSYMTTESRHYPNMFKIPYTAQYDDISFTFTLTKNLNERKFFEIWQESVVNITTGTLNFYNEYVSNIKMHQLDSCGNPSYSIELVNAYPIALGGLDYSFADTDGVLTSSVTFTYEYWRNLDFNSASRYSFTPY